MIGGGGNTVEAVKVRGGANGGGTAFALYAENDGVVVSAGGVYDDIVG